MEEMAGGSAKNGTVAGHADGRCGGVVGGEAEGATPEKVALLGPRGDAERGTASRASGLANAVGESH